MTIELNYARLDREKIAKLQTLEEETGTVIVAYQPAIKPAELSDEQLKKLKQAEAELDVVLVAYQEE